MPTKGGMLFEDSIGRVVIMDVLGDKLWVQCYDKNERFQFETDLNREQVDYLMKNLPELRKKMEE
jgi:hypothetical protein